MIHEPISQPFRVDAIRFLSGHVQFTERNRVNADQYQNIDFLSLLLIRSRLSMPFYSHHSSLLNIESPAGGRSSMKARLHTSIRVLALKSGPKGLSEESWLICSRAHMSQVKPSLHLFRDFRNLLQMLPPFDLSLKTYSHNICNAYIGALFAAKRKQKV